MHPAILIACLALGSSALLAGYLLVKRERTALHGSLLALVASLMIWTTGIIIRFSVTSEQGLEAALRILFLGIFLAPPCWMMVAACYARVPALSEGRYVWPRVLAPSALGYLGILTNDGHHLMLREVSFAAMAAGGRAWAGPFFWAFMVWAYGCVLVGAYFYLRTAGTLVALDERRRGSLLIVASVLPLLGAPVYLFRILPVSFDLTPITLTASVLLLSVAVFRYQLLENLPLARRDVIEHLHDGVVMASASGVILDLNPAAEKILGASGGRLERRPLVEVLVELGDAEGARRIRRAFERLQPAAEPFDTEVLTPEQRRIGVSAAWVQDEQGETAGMFAVLRDRTEERRFERLVRHTQKLQTVGTLAAGIAHEVNNPLAFIRANLGEIHRMGEWVEMREKEEGRDGSLGQLLDLRNIAEETLDGIGRIERIVAGMRRLASRRDETLHPVDANEVVRDALRLASLARDPQLSVERALADDLPPVDGAPGRLVQALLNLLVNAHQALEGSGGTIRVESASVDGFVEIRVSDDGPGIPEEIQERIFDPFFTTKDPDQGTGLGLAIAFDILRDHGGSLEVSSQPGAGARFVARIPRRR